MDGLTPKKRREMLDEKHQGLCKLCGGNNGVQYHHIIGGSGKRTQCETIYSLIPLCLECHHGDYGVHGKNGYKLDKELKDGLQETYEELGLEEEELKYWLGGRFYVGVD